MDYWSPPAGFHPKTTRERLAEVFVVSRPCEPSIELHIAEQFYHSNALADLVGLPDEEIQPNRLYRASTGCWSTKTGSNRIH